MAGNILVVVAQIVGLIVLGALLKLAQILRTEHAALLNSLVMNLTLPATVFLAVRKVRNQPWQELLKVPLVAYVVIAVCGVLAYVLTRFMRLERRTAGVFILIAILGSTAFLGYPVVDGLFKPADYPNCAGLNAQECQAMVASYCENNAEACQTYNGASGAAAFYSELGTLIPMLTVAVVIASRYGEGEHFTWRNLLAVLKSGPLMGFLIGLLFLNDDIPGVITGILDFLRLATVPLIMLSLGITIRWRDFFGRQGRALIIVNVVKLLVAPVLALVLCILLGMDGAMRTVAVLMAALPSFMFSLSYANQYKLDVEFASNALFASFFFGAITLPVVVSLIPH